MLHIQSSLNGPKFSVALKLFGKRYHSSTDQLVTICDLQAGIVRVCMLSSPPFKFSAC